MLFAGVGGNSRNVYNTDINNFAPRVALAWRVRNDTVLRAGYGIFFDTNPPSTQASVDAYIAPQSYPANTITNGVPAFRFPDRCPLSRSLS